MEKKIEKSSNGFVTEIIKEDALNYYITLINSENKQVANSKVCVFGAPDNIKLYVISFNVGKEFQSKGYGRMLMHTIIELAKEKGCSEIDLQADRDTLGFCDGLGFVGDNGPCLGNGVHMVKTLKEQTKVK